MTKLTLSLVGLVAASGITASLVIQQGGRVNFGEKTEAFRRQAEELTRLSVENERLSNLVARTSSQQTLRPEELSELLRLRGQIGLLRQAGKELVQLQVANEKLRAGPATAVDALAEARAAPNFWAKDQLAFAGYAEPEAALKTMLWAVNKGDIKSFLASWASGSEVAAELGKELGGKSETELAAEGKKLSESLDPMIGFHILDKQVTSADEVTLDLSCDGEGKVRKFVMKRVGNEWKAADVTE
jgi:TolA-binding protein